MIYLRTWFLFLRSLGCYYLHPSGNDKYSLAGKRLVSLSFRIPNKDKKSFLFFLKSFAHALLAKRIKMDEACHTYSPGGVYIYDLILNPEDEKERISHVSYFRKESPNGSISKLKLLGYLNLYNKSLQLIFEFLLFIPLLPVAVFEEYKGSAGLIFLEYIELVNLLKTLKTHHVRVLYYYSIYEKDSNISSIAIQKLGITVKKVTSLTPIKYWNSIIVGTDTLILCDAFQLEELEVFKDTIQVKNVEIWGPENIDIPVIPYENGEKHSPNKNAIGFYSSAGYHRSAHGELDEWNFEKNENKVMTYLAEYLRLKPDIKLTVFPHPREKTAENKERMLKHYETFFSGIDYSVYQESLPSSACFDSVDLGISMYSSVIFGRLFYGYKCLMMPFGEEGMGTELTSIKNICAKDKADFFSKINEYLSLSVNEYFEKTGLPKSSFHSEHENTAAQTADFVLPLHEHRKKSNIIIIDYGLGNLASIQNMIRKLGYIPRITSDPSEIRSAEKIILPGVGAFARGMKNLTELGLIEELNRKALNDKIPVLGICLGMQLLTSHSEEGDAAGLGWIPVQTKKFAFNNGENLPVPHMGWADVSYKGDHPLFKDAGQNVRYYFAHSYYISSDTSYSIANALYGISFSCAIAKDNIMGVQFHPEKSHHFGLSVLNNFICNV